MGSGGDEIGVLHRRVPDPFPVGKEGVHADVGDAAQGVGRQGVLPPGGHEQGVPGAAGVPRAAGAVGEGGGADTGQEHEGLFHVGVHVFGHGAAARNANGEHLRRPRLFTADEEVVGVGAEIVGGAAGCRGVDGGGEDHGEPRSHAAPRRAGGAWWSERW